MKLYTYTTEPSLPRMAMKGMRDGFSLIDDISLLAELMEEAEEKNLVVLEVDVSGLDDIMVIGEDTMESVASSAAYDAQAAGEDTEAAYSRIYNADMPSIEKMLEVFGEVQNAAAIPASRITVLGRIKSLTFPEGLDEPGEVKFKGAPKPLKAFQQPLVTRLLRSIFLPKHKLYGAGRRGPAMGFISRFLPKFEEVEVDELPPDVVSEIPLVWASGKTFRRGMRGAFGPEDGDAIGQLVSMRVGQEPGKYLGSGARGAVYALGSGRVLKVTMDGNEVRAATNLIGIQHPNLSLVHDAFIVTNGEKGAGIIVRDAIDTTLDKFDKETAEELNQVMDMALELLTEKIGENVGRIQNVDPQAFADTIEVMVGDLRKQGCDVDSDMILSVADALRMLKHLEIFGIDFDAQNVGIIKKPHPRVVLFDYGMTKSPLVEVEVVSLESLRA